MSLENTINRLTQVIKAASNRMSAPTSPWLPGDDQFPRDNSGTSKCAGVRAQITSNPNIRILGCLEETGRAPGCQCTTYQRSIPGGAISASGPVAVPCRWSECITLPVMF
jgi:hypothetical protein